MPDIQTPRKPRKPRAKRTIAVADLLQGIEKAKQSPRQDPAGALAFLSGWFKKEHPALAAGLIDLARLKGD